MLLMLEIVTSVSLRLSRRLDSFSSYSRK